MCVGIDIGWDAIGCPLEYRRPSILSRFYPAVAADVDLAVAAWR